MTTRVFAAAMGLALGATAGATVFNDAFDAYTPGAQMHGVNGWKGWDNLAGAGALVSSARAYSGSNSLHVTGATDLVHEHSIVTGSWSYTAKQWIDSGAAGVSYFIVMNTYADGGNSDWQWWSSQLKFDLGANTVRDDLRSGSNRVTLRRDQWAEVRVDIDLDANTMSSYYDGSLIYSGSWTQGSRSARRIGALDLYAGSGSSFYDNVSLAQVPAPSAASLLFLGAAVAAGRSRVAPRR